MGSYPVDDGQLALYFVFTFISIALSIAAYCIYFHGFKFADPDYTDHIRAFAKISRINEQNTDRNRVESPLID
jgi:hypothetical protein